MTRLKHSSRMSSIHPTSGDRGARLASSLALLGVVGFAAFIVSQSIIGVLHDRDVFPFYDMILVDYRYFAASAHDFWIFRDNEHLPLFAMPLFWADLRLFGGQGLFLVLCNMVLAAGIGLGTTAAIHRAARLRPALAAATSALIVLLMLWFGNRANLTWPKQVHMYLSLFALTMAFRRAAPARPIAAGDALTISAWLLVATFSFGYGVIGFACMGLLAIQRRWNWTSGSILAATLLVCLAIYDALSFGVGYLNEGVPLLHGGLLRGADYALTFIAFPVIAVSRSFVPESEAEAIGRLAASAGTAFLVWRIARGFFRRPDEIESWWLLLSTFTMCNAAETAFARAARFGVSGGLEYRYVVGELPFWIALVLLAFRCLTRSSWQSLVVAGTAALVAEFGLLHSQHYEFGIQRNITAIRWQAAMSALDGVVDKNFLTSLIWPTTDQVVVTTEGLRRHHLSVFAWPEQSWLGENVGQFRHADKVCEGALERVTRVDGTAGLLVEGWVLDKHVTQGSGWIVLADKSGTIVALAHDGMPRVDLLISRRDGRLRNAGWLGYVVADRPPDGLVAYLMLSGDRTCRLASAGVAS